MTDEYSNIAVIFRLICDEMKQIRVSFQEVEKRLEYIDAEIKELKFKIQKMDDHIRENTLMLADIQKTCSRRGDILLRAMARTKPPPQLDIVSGGKYVRRRPKT